ncbi:hypothetical protein Sjap_026165 [Stephania japonica]|uniref:Uncharacterized protein n=1 Tax=Stephania japonica TaxID=461633 RepID=A0AAP0HG86_9MAGN
MLSVVVAHVTTVIFTTPYALPLGINFGIGIRGLSNSSLMEKASTKMRGAV